VGEVKRKTPKGDGKNWELKKIRIDGSAGKKEGLVPRRAAPVCNNQVDRCLRLKKKAKTRGGGDQIPFLWGMKVADRTKDVKGNLLTRFI